VARSARFYPLGEGGVSNLATVIRNPENSQHVKVTYIPIWNTPREQSITWIALSACRGCAAALTWPDPQAEIEPV